jgi:hypothetical protein
LVALSAAKAQPSQRQQEQSSQYAQPDQIIGHARSTQNTQHDGDHDHRPDHRQTEQADAGFGTSRQLGLETLKSSRVHDGSSLLMDDLPNAPGRR